MEYADEPLLHRLPRSPITASVPASSSPPVLTRDGRAWIQARLDRAIERLARVDAELGNERAEELVAERGQLLDQVEELRQLLRDAVTPADLADDPTIMEIGDEVEVEFPDGAREVFLIVHPIEAGMDERRTSAEAPVAKAVLGNRVGDRVTVSSPAGDYSCTIISRKRIG